jgi:hypothetical protein
MKKIFAFAALFVLLASFSIILKTSLNVTVRDETGNLVPGASIKLYSNRENWEKEVNHFAEGVTDEKGLFKFKEVNQLNIFILVRKEDKDNTNGGEQTKLEDGKINKITVIIQE